MRDLPLWVKAPLATAVQLAPAVVEAGAVGLVVGQPLAGAGMRLPGDGSSQAVYGDLFGPLAFAPMLATLLQVAALQLPCALIACGGVHTLDQVRQALAAGAAAVQMDSAVWVEPGLPGRLWLTSQWQRSGALLTGSGCIAMLDVMAELHLCSSQTTRSPGPAWLPSSRHSRVSTSLGRAKAAPTTWQPLCAAFQPDVVIWDLGWQPAAQLEALSHFADEHAPPIVALLSSPELVQESRAAGARALLSRNTTGPQLAAAAQAVAQELLVFDEAFARAPVTVAPGEPLVEPLSQRELDVLRALAEGLSNKQIARQLEISEHTVKFHVNAILGKLGVQSRTEAVVRATRAGLILLCPILQALVTVVGETQICLCTGAVHCHHPRQQTKF